MISAFLWQHVYAQRVNAWLVGILIALIALASMSAPSIRFLNTILAAWLFISPWILHGARRGTIWNNVLVALVVFCLSLYQDPSSSATRATGAERRSSI
jgi:hypothetical protein